MLEATSWPMQLGELIQGEHIASLRACFDEHVKALKKKHQEASELHALPTLDAAMVEQLTNQADALRKAFLETVSVAKRWSAPKAKNPATSKRKGKKGAEAVTAEQGQAQ